jgi:hypothetical protein
MGKRIRNPSSDHHLNDYDHHHNSCAYNNNYRCANDHYHDNEFNDVKYDSCADYDVVDYLFNQFFNKYSVRAGRNLAPPVRFARLCGHPYWEEPRTPI